MKVICNFWHPGTLTSDAQPWAPECPDAKNYKGRLNPIWHLMPYSFTRMATVGVKGLICNGFYPLDAMLASVFATATCLSVCPSVCHAPVLYQNKRKLA